MKFVPEKSLEQQGVQALHSARSLLVKQQTMLANAMRSLAAEFGLIVPKGIGKLRELMELVDADATFPKRALQAVRGLLDHCGALAESIETFEAEIVAHARHDKTARRLATIPPASVRSLHPSVRRLARSSAATALYRREDPAWSDHQSWQPGDTHDAGPRSHVND